MRPGKRHRKKPIKKPEQKEPEVIKKKRPKRRLHYKMRLRYKGRVYSKIKVNKEDLVVYKRHPDTVDRKNSVTASQIWRCSPEPDPRKKRQLHKTKYADGMTPARAIAGYLIKYYGVEVVKKHPRKRTVFYR